MNAKMYSVKWTHQVAKSLTGKLVKEKKTTTNVDMV